MSLEITWSPLALERVLEASEYIARDKPEAARRWADRIFAAAERLSQFPQSGRVVPELGRPEVREVLLGSYRIIYRLQSSQVLILTVRHTRRLLDPRETE